MAAYCAVVRELKGKLDGVELHRIKRNNSITTNNLARIVASKKHVPNKNVLRNTAQTISQDPITKTSELYREQVVLDLTLVNLSGGVLS